MRSKQTNYLTEISYIGFHGNGINKIIKNDANLLFYVILLVGDVTLCLQTKNSILSCIMFSCLKSQKRDFPPPPPPIIVVEPTRSQRKLSVLRIYNNDPPIIRNEYLDPRDERIYIPFSVQRCSQITTLEETIMNEITEWLMKANYVITSRGFRHLSEGKLTQIQSKTYTSRNMLLNVKELMGALAALKQELREELMVKVNAVEAEILSELMLKYPQSTLRGASKRIRSLVRKIDNRQNYDYDFLFKNDFTFPFRPDGHYASDLMRALNKMISFANEVYTPERGANTDQDSYFQIWSQLIEFIVANDAKASPRAFFRGFDFIYTYSDPDSTSEEVKPEDKPQQVRPEGEKMEESSRSRLKVNHKIPLEVNLFSEEDIESGQCKIRNSSVLRVIAKWTFELLEKLKNPKETFLHRAEKFKLLSNKLYSLQNNQKLAIYEAALKEGQRIDDYIAQLRRQYILLQTVFARDRSRHRVGTEDNDLEVYALRVREVYSQCLFKLLCKLVDALKRVPRSAAEIYLQRHENELPEDELRANYEVLRQVDLVSFKVGDLIRAKYACSESEFLRIYKNLIEVSEQRPEVLKIVRIKNRLDHKENDILLNMFFMNKVQCQLQLSFERVDQDNARKAKLYSSYNHFLYQLRRSLLGPIGEYACILGEHDPVVSMYVMLDKFALRQKTLLQEADRNEDPATEKRKSANEMFLPDKISQNTIAIANNHLRQVTPGLREIHQILFLCEHCGDLKKPANLHLPMHKHEDGSEEEDQPPIKQCRQCFLNKLQKSLEEGRVGTLLGIVLGQQREQTQLLFHHLQPWDPSLIPLQFRAQQLQSYLPREGFVLSKQSRVIAFHYFRTFSDEDYTYLVSKSANQCQTVARLNRILKQDQILEELTAIMRKFFLFRFDKQVSIEDGCSFGFGREGTVDVAVCAGECCKAPFVLGPGVEFREFNEAINKMFIRKMLEEFMNVMYLSKRHIGSMINQIVLQDKKYDRSCKNVTIIEAEDSHLRDIRFAAKMVNLSDLYIRYNGQLDSLKGIEQCRNLKILYCNECKISSLVQLKGLTALQELSINENRVTSLEGLENCVNLKQFSCFWNQISTLEPIKNCKNLEKLDIGQNNITTLTPLAPLAKLKSLSISKNSLASLDGIQTLSSLQVIDFSHTAISELSLLQQCPKIQRIFCSNTPLTSLSGITAPNLIELDCGQCTRLLEFDLSLPACASLQELTADKCANMRRLKNIERCVKLREFYLQDNPNLYPQEFALIGRCLKLEELNVSGNKTLGSLYFLERLEKLSNLSCSKCEQLNNLHFASIKKCPSIQILNLSHNRSLTNPDFLKGCINLHHLNLSATGVRKFDRAFLKLAEMRYLELKDMRDLQIANFDFIRDSPQMEKIVIDEIHDIQSLKGLERMGKLKQVLIGRLLKPDESRLGRLEKELQKMPIKVQRSVRLLYDPI